ncbi:inhibin beta E chain-like [Polyodon spathula]|uniref:inhibin beta E chain-like n=1 Tax=Polyodon spathula TaxID=7913 RepID=UPI001B7DA5D6|nr:inhibin beta E chain-like [Polyodon spathula]
MLLDALNLKQAPHINIEGMSQITAALRKELKGISQNSNLSSVEKTDPGFLNTTAENNTQREKTEPHCCQITSQIFITDLGWESWIVYPESFSYTQCESCSHGRSRTWQHCRQGGPSAEHHDPKVKCCLAVEHLWLRFVYTDEDSNLVASNVPLTQMCGCQLD